MSSIPETKADPETTPLTDTQIDALTGRELDAEVATRVLGWSWWKCRGKGFTLLQPLDPDDRCMWSLRIQEEVTGREQEFPRYADWDRLLPRYSTDPTASAALLDHMRDRFSFALWDVRMVSSVQRGPVAAFSQSVFPPERRQPHESQVSANGDGAELKQRRYTAIARAALKAVEATPCP